jgi:uncharacterized protein YecE (DUF72 family)
MTRGTRKATEKQVESGQRAKVLVGPAGWAYKDWNGVVYATPRTRDFHQATYLAEFFDTIEINTSFYHPLQASHAAQWVRHVAANPRFLFTAKLWQKFTHEGGTNLEDEKAVSFRKRKSRSFDTDAGFISGLSAGGGSAAFLMGQPKILRAAA